MNFPKQITIHIFGLLTLALITTTGCVIVTTDAATPETAQSEGPTPVPAKPRATEAPPAPPAEPPNEEAPATPTPNLPEEEAPDSATPNTDTVVRPKLKTIDGPFYIVKIRTDRVAEDKVESRVIVLPKGEYHCNTEYPWRLTPHPTGKIRVSKRSYTKGDAKVFGEKKVVFEVPYSAPKGLLLKTNLKASLCNESQCETVKLDLKI